MNLEMARTEMGESWRKMTKYTRKQVAVEVCRYEMREQRGPCERLTPEKMGR